MARNEDAQREIGAEINGPGKQFFDDVVHDNLWESLVELTAAVWTYHDRTLILERVLQDLVGDGQDIATLIEQYEPTEEDNAARAAEREELVNNVFRSFSRRAGGNAATLQHALTQGD